MTGLIHRKSLKDTLELYSFYLGRGGGGMGEVVLDKQCEIFTFYVIQLSFL